MREFLLLVLIITYTSSVLGQNLRNLSKAEIEQIEVLEEMVQLQVSNAEYGKAGETYSKIAFIYWRGGRPRMAIDKFIISSDYLLQDNKLEDVKNVFSNLGVLYTDLEELEFAFDFFDKSLRIRRKLGTKNDIAAGLIDVAFILQVLKFHDDAIERLLEALQLSTEENNSRLILDCYQLLSLNYEQSGNIRKANEFAGKAESFQVYLQTESLEKELTSEVIETQQEVAKSQAERELERQLYLLQQQIAQQEKDSLNVSLQSKQDSLFEAAREAKERQRAIKYLETQKELDNARIEQQEAKQAQLRIVIISIAGGFVLMIVLAIVMIRANRARKRANVKLEKQNKEIAEKSEQLGTALKKIAHQNQNITQSINYAKGIQQALLPKPEQLTGYLDESFIFFRPRDIVSGDFYWFREIDAKSDIFKIFGMHRKTDDKKDSKEAKKFVISAVDCTGHGVPGAFMSMIGYNLLDEITNKGISRPDLILEELHKGVRFTLKQKETNNQDGMDMALCVVDKQNKVVEFAGAKNPLVYIQNGEVKQIKGDKYGIGGKTEDAKFTTHKIEINGPTWFYLFSDGFIDQFGGDNGRKFMIKHFREYLFSIHKEGLMDQPELLNKTLKEWIGTKYSQIDDILVIGFKLDFN